MNPAQLIINRAKSEKRADKRRSLFVKAKKTQQLQADVRSRSATEAAFAERNAQREESRRADR
jgi:hypothetical protein